MEPGKYTIETFAKNVHLTKQSALNLLSKLKRRGFISVSGGGRQKRIYTVYTNPQLPSNGFYDIVNRYSPEKLVPQFKHRVIGRYTTEQAIIDGIRIGDARALAATQYLFNQVKNWRRLFDLAKKRGATSKVKQLYKEARNRIKVRKMPQRYA